MGFTRDGSHAEFIVVPVEAVTPKPHNLSVEQAACVGVNFVTAYLGLVVRATLQPGETLLVTGAIGGVGSAVSQLGQGLKARLIAADRTPFEAGAFERLDLVGYVDTSQTPLGEAVLQFTNGVGVDVAFDCVGGELFEPALSSLRQLGRHVAITSVGTRRVSFDLPNFYHRRLSLFGVDSRSLTVIESSRLLAAIAPEFESGRLRPSPISKRGTLEEVSELYAVRRQWRKRQGDTMLGLTTSSFQLFPHRIYSVSAKIDLCETLTQRIVVGGRRLSVRRLDFFSSLSRRQVAVGR